MSEPTSDHRVPGTDRIRRVAERMGPLGIAFAGLGLRTVLGERAFDEMATAWERNPPTTWPPPEREHRDE